MTNLNEVTKRLDGTTFDTYSVTDLVNSIMTEDEIKGLNERLAYLETVNDLDVAADGFGDKYDDFSGMDLFNERSMLRSILGQ